MASILAECDGDAFGSVEEIIYAGSTFSPALVRRALRRFPRARFAQGYGMTEANHIAVLPCEVHDAIRRGAPVMVTDSDSSAPEDYHAHCKWQLLASLSRSLASMVLVPVAPTVIAGLYGDAAKVA